jgi:hypothetical protein
MADSLVLGKSEFREQTKGEAGQSVAGTEETDKDGYIRGCKQRREEVEGRGCCGRSKSA